MAKLAFQKLDLHVTLGPWEKIGALHGDIVLPLQNIVGAEVLPKNWWTQLGLRVPGTAIPGLVLLGTYVRRGDRAFVAWTRGQQVLQINLTNHRYSRIVVGVNNPDEWVDEITMYLTSC
jgi:hypothetical protein